MSTKSRIFAAAAALLLLSSCAFGEENVQSRTQSKGTARPVKSSIFGKNADYSSFTPADGLKLPAEDIADIAQTEKRLYILGGGALHLLDLETGESSKLFETSSEHMAACGNELVLLDADASGFDVYGASGELLKSCEVLGIPSGGVSDIAACDGCVILLCGGKFICLDRSDGSKMNEIPAKKFTKAICACGGNKALVCAGDAAYGSSLYELDAEKGSLKKLRDLPLISEAFDIAYNPKSGTAIVLGSGPGGLSLLCEYDLESEDNGVLAKFDINLWVKKHISVYENIVSVISGGVYRRYDYETPPESVTLAYIGEDSAQNIDLETIILGYEMSRGVTVRTVCYNDDRTRLSLKLMAGDSDIDIFSTLSTDGCLFVDSHMYAALDGFEPLSRKIGSNAAAELACRLNGEYVGLPYGVSLEADCLENVSGFTAIEQYCIKNVDALNMRFSDPDGSELYKIMKFAAEDPEPQKAYYDFPYSILSSEYLMINPASEKKELAADFLEYAFDVYSGAEKPFTGGGGYSPSPLMYPYPELSDAENVYTEIVFRPWSIVGPLFEAYNSARYGTVTDKGKLKKLAKEAAAETAMRIGE